MNIAFIVFLTLCSFPLFSVFGSNQQTVISSRDQNYFIPWSYVARSKYYHHDDTSYKNEYQNEVYFFANQVRENKGYTNIADVGCGSGYKLLKFFGDCQTVGFEIHPTLSFLQSQYPDRSWQLSDLSMDPPRDPFDLVICADVIEHLVDPDLLLNWLARMNFQYLVISTPDRYLLSANTQKGPPGNPAHVREWGFDEFEKYVAQYFEVISHFHTEEEYWGQVILAKRKDG